MSIRILGLTASLLVSASALADARDVQIRSVDFQTGVLELHNFGSEPEALDGWRFCSHDEDQVRRYSGGGGLNGVSIDAGGSLSVHFLNDASGPDAIDVSSIGGGFALPLDSGSYGIQIYWPGADGILQFGNGNDIADHLQWSIGGIDDPSADERSDEAVAGGVWMSETDWISTTADSLRIVLTDETGGVLHGSRDYDVEEPSAGCAADIVGDDGEVTTQDLLELLANWGTDGPGAGIAMPADVVDTSDLLGLLAAWGPC